MHAIKSDHSNIFQIPEFSFKHSAHFIPPTPSSRTLMHIYEKCLLSVDIPNVDDGVDGKFDPKRSHNLLMGMNWLMVVPRSVSDIGEVSCNGLNFIGSYFFKSEKLFEEIRSDGLMKTLERFGYSKL
eukprot:TRINITY_DN6071_c0_g1_i5.p1 TRINITY_DN6071_c0_g1~~TRINITY_DN6071_c0_g1_i5.p1  ORF type:complete len:127 (-),score=30.39 TRINITY_DN6071_c0_g1_i5:69-449(-)